MTRGGLAGFIVCAAFAVVPSAFAQPSTSGPVTVRLVRAGELGAPERFSAGAPINLTSVDDTVTAIRIYGSTADANSIIGHLTIAGPRLTQAPLDVFIGEGDGSGAMRPFPNVGDWTGMSISPLFKGYVRLSASIGGNLIGPVTVSEIDHLSVGFDDNPTTGLIDGAVTVRNGSVGIRSLSAYRMSSKSRINVQGGNIARIDLGCGKHTCGELLGNIEVNSGSIGTLLVKGPIGSDDHPVHITSANGIDFLMCDRFIGDIDANLSLGKGWIKYLECSQGGFTGTLHAAGLGLMDPGENSPHGMFIAGTFDGRLLVDGDITYYVLAQNFAPTSEIIVGGTLLARIISGSPSSEGNIGTARFGAIGPFNPEFSDSLPLGISAKGHIGSVEVLGPAVAPTSIVTEIKITAASVDLVRFNDAARFDLAGAAPGTGLRVGELHVGGSFTEGIWDLASVSLIDLAGDCGAQLSLANSTPGTLVRVGHDLTGLFRFADPEGWKGQVIVNAADGGGVWTRAARVDRCDGCTQPIGPGAYPQTSQELGGGSIGVVPFLLHDADCLPRPNTAQPPLVLDSEFQRADLPGNLDKAAGVVLSFYGPVKSAGSGPLVRLFRVLTSGEQVELTDHCRSVIADPDAAGFSRSCIVSGNPDFYFAPGDYRLEVDATCSLACAGLETGQTVPVAAMSYYFEIGTDCDGNGLLDATQIANEPYSDVNADGFLDLCQRMSGQLCVADFNLDGAVDGADRELFEVLYEAGYLAADINLDGGVDGRDFETFYVAFEIGC